MVTQSSLRKVKNISEAQKLNRRNQIIEEREVLAQKEITQPTQEGSKYVYKGVEVENYQQVEEAMTRAREFFDKRIPIKYADEGGSTEAVGELTQEFYKDLLKQRSIQLDEIRSEFASKVKSGELPKDAWLDISKTSAGNLKVKYGETGRTGINPSELQAREVKVETPTVPAIPTPVVDVAPSTPRRIGGYWLSEFRKSGNIVQSTLNVAGGVAETSYDYDIQKGNIVPSTQEEFIRNVVKTSPNIAYFTPAGGALMLAGGVSTVTSYVANPELYKEKKTEIKQGLGINNELFANVVTTSLPILEAELGFVAVNSQIKNLNLYKDLTKPEKKVMELWNKNYAEDYATARANLERMNKNLVKNQESRFRLLSGDTGVYQNFDKYPTTILGESKLPQTVDIGIQDITSTTKISKQTENVLIKELMDNGIVNTVSEAKKYIKTYSIGAGQINTKLPSQLTLINLEARPIDKFSSQLIESAKTVNLQPLESSPFIGRYQGNFGILSKGITSETDFASINLISNLNKRGKLGKVRDIVITKGNANEKFSVSTYFRPSKKVIKIPVEGQEPVVETALGYRKGKVNIVKETLSKNIKTDGGSYSYVLTDTSSLLPKTNEFLSKPLFKSEFGKKVTQEELKVLYEQSKPLSQELSLRASGKPGEVVNDLFINSLTLEDEGTALVRGTLQKSQESFSFGKTKIIGNVGKKFEPKVLEVLPPRKPSKVSDMISQPRSFEVDNVIADLSNIKDLTLVETVVPKVDKVVRKDILNLPSKVEFDVPSYIEMGGRGTSLIAPSPSAELGTEVLVGTAVGTQVNNLLDIKSRQKVFSELPTKDLIGVKELQLIKVKDELDVLTAKKEINPVEGGKIRSKVFTSAKERFKVLEKQLDIPAQKTFLRQDVKPLERTDIRISEPKLRFDFGRPKPSEPTKTTKKIIIPRIDMNLLPEDKATFTDRDLFRVLIRKKGQDVLIAKTETQQGAIQRLVRELKGTVAASGKITLGKKALPFSKLNLGQEFRASKLDPFRVVQRKENRLKGRGETSQIKTFRGKRSKWI